MAKQKKSLECPRNNAVISLTRELRETKNRLDAVKEDREIKLRKIEGIESENSILKQQINGQLEALSEKDAEARGFERGVTRILEVILDRLVRN